MALSLALAVGRCNALHAQVIDAPRDASLLLRRVLVRPFSDTVVVDLRKHGQYRVALWPASLQLRVAPTAHPEQTDFAPRVREGTSSRATAVELYPQEDGPHLLSFVAPAGADSAVLWIWESVDAEAAARARHEHRIAIGFATEGGIGTGYTIDEPTRPKPSPYLEGAALIGNDEHLALLLGAGNDPRPAGLISVMWFFAEFRAGVARATLGGHDLDLALTVRYSMGDATTSGKDPVAFGGGALVTWHLDQRHGAHGWQLGAHATVLDVRGNGIEQQMVGRFGLTLSWVP